MDLKHIDLLTLIGRDTTLRRKANTNGGEYAGPCPLCGGGADRFLVWPRADRPGFWCRMCDCKGDAIDYLRLQGKSFAEACRELQVTPDLASVPPAPTPPPAIERPTGAWEDSAVKFLVESQEMLWSALGSRARDWLKRRGLNTQTIIDAQLGYNGDDRRDEPEAWGLPADHAPVWLPRGIVIPWCLDLQIWKMTIRRPVGDVKYATVAGSVNALYGADNLRPDRAACLVEGAFDAMVIQQAASTIVTPVASGTTGARGWLWVQQLAQCGDVLIGLDADEAGDHGARWWGDVLTNSRRWRPYLNDPAEMAEKGLDVRGWIEAGLASVMEVAA